MIDFTDMPKLHKGYGGANGNKICVRYDNDRWMLKFPSTADRNKNISYSNSPVCEYIGSHIFQLLGIPAQDTVLGTYTVRGKEKIVVACRDFEKSGTAFQDFASLKNQIITSERGGYGTDLNDILETFQSQDIADPDILESYFWNMFIVDAFIGNWDRHNGNWGFLYNQDEDSLSFAPIFDCGSCLYSQTDLELKEHILNDKNALHKRIYNIPTSAVKIDNKRLNYFNFISGLESERCTEALFRIVPRINMDEIRKMIDEIEYIFPTEKEFYATMLQARKELILDYSLNKAEKMIEVGKINIDIGSTIER